MWLLVLFTIFNSVSSQEGVINNLRVGAGGIFVGSMEAIMLTLLGYALIFGGGLTQLYPNRRTHPALLVIMSLWILTVITGTIESLMNHVEVPFYLRSVREFAAWPLYVFVGYRMLATPQSAYRFMYAIIFAGTLAATILIAHFGENAEAAGIYDNLNTVRSVQYVNSYAGMAAMVLIYSMIGGIRLMPKFIALPLACYCLVGQCAPLHRGEWMAMMLCAVLMLFLIDPRKIASTLLKGAVVGALVICGLGIAINIAGRLMQRDFSEKVQERLVSMLPIERKTTTETKAWDTRLDSISEELEIWKSSPLLGQGFAIQEQLIVEGKITNFGAFNHNGWASVLCKNGVIGFIPSMLFVASLLWFGRKLVLAQAHPGTVMMGVLAMMGAGYMITGILAGIMWSMRLAMFYGVVGGMMFRCVNMQYWIHHAEEGVPESLPDEPGHLDPLAADAFGFNG